MQFGNTQANGKINGISGDVDLNVGYKTWS